MKVPEKVVELLRRWYNDPVSFVRECLKAEPDVWQAKVLRCLVEQKDPDGKTIKRGDVGFKLKTCLKACKGPGKTTLLAWIAWWFLVTRLHAKVIACSISRENLRDGLWTEMAKWQQNSEFLLATFTWNKESITSNEFPATWYMVARAFSKTADKTQQATTLSGLHAENLLFLLDEVAEYPDAVVTTAEAALSTGKETRLIMAGNPSRTDGPLWRACTSEVHLWDVHEVTGDPDDPNRAPRIKIDWAREEIAKWGKDSPWVLVNVFGRFPPGSINALIGPDAMDEAFRRNPPYEQWAFAQRRTGTDVARFGDDLTVIGPRQGLIAFLPTIMRPDSSNVSWSQQVAGRIMNYRHGVSFGDMKELSNWRSDVEFVDGTGGYGAGVVDALRAVGQNPISVDFGSSADDPTRFANKRAEIIWRFVEAIKNGLSLPLIPRLKAELTSITYSFDNQGRILMEPKEMIKKRLGFSTDYTDAYALTFSTPDMPRDRSEMEWGPKESAVAVGVDYDPFDLKV